MKKGWHEFNKHLGRICDLLRFEYQVSALFNSGRGEYIPSEYQGYVIDSYCELLEHIYDCEDAISWFLFDNDMGRKGYEYNGIQVFTIKDLYEAISKIG